MSIPAAFGLAAQSYDAAAAIQNEVAATLLAQVDAREPRRILDIGCGTGLVTALAAARWPKAAITGLDAAPAMLAAAQAKLPQVRFALADAGNIPPTEQFDLVLSSMALHWLPDPAAALAQWQSLLAPGGAMHVAVPVQGSLGEWKALCARHGIQDRLWRFPARHDFAADGAVHCHRVIHDDARAFLASMKKTGAASASPATAAMPPSVLRALLRAAPKPFPVSFAIAYLHWP